MAASLRFVGVSFAAWCAQVAVAEEPIPFVGPPAPPPPLILRKFAGDVFNLDLFKLHIPLDDDGDGIADEVGMPLLRNFEDPAFFHIDKGGEAIVFRARRGDATRKGTNHPRSELWERRKEADTPAAWGTQDGLVHNLTLAFAFTRLPEDGSSVSAVAVHGGKGEVIAIRHEGGRVVLSRNGLEPIVLQEGYVAGTRLDLMIVLDRGRVRAFHDTKQLAEWPLEEVGLHFRAGVVLETDSKADKATKSVAEVAIWKLYLTHKSN